MTIVSSGELGLAFGATCVPVPVGGDAVYSSTGTYTWTAPTGVTSVSVVAVSAGDGNQGGALGFKNDIAVTAGSSYTVYVGAGYPSPQSRTSYFINTSTVPLSVQGGIGVGGGAAGYGFGSGCGGGGQGGTSANFGSRQVGSERWEWQGGSGGGGGVGLYGKGATGANGGAGAGGGGGSGGSPGSAGTPSSCTFGGPGGPGGSAGGSGGAYGIAQNYQFCYLANEYVGCWGQGAPGAVRIVWPGKCRSFPSTSVSTSSLTRIRNRSILFELNCGSNTRISLNDANVRTLAGKTTPSSQISFSDFYCKTQPCKPGHALYTSSGTYSWLAPTGISNVSVLAVGAGRYGGGGLAWYNNLSITQGTSYTVVVGAGLSRTNTTTPTNVSYFCSTNLVSATGGASGSDGAGTGTSNAPIPCRGAQSGGSGNGTSGGAAGYQGPGAYGGQTSAPSGGGGGAGGSADATIACAPPYQGVPTFWSIFGGVGGAGGVGLYGVGPSGATDPAPPAGIPGFSARGGARGTGGSGGNPGGAGSTSTKCSGGSGGGGGQHGGGAGFYGYAVRTCVCEINVYESVSGSAGTGGTGAIRIVWPGHTRKFPSTNVASAKA